MTDQLKPPKKAKRTSEWGIEVQESIVAPRDNSPSRFTTIIVWWECSCGYDSHSHQDTDHVSIVDLFDGYVPICKGCGKRVRLK